MAAFAMADYNRNGQTDTTDHSKVTYVRSYPYPGQLGGGVGAGKSAVDVGPADAAAARSSRPAACGGVQPETMRRGLGPFMEPCTS